MITLTIQRYLTTSRLPSCTVFGISRFSTSRRLLAFGRAPQVRKLEREQKGSAKQNVPSRSPPPQGTSENPLLVSLPKTLLVDAQIAGQLSISWHEAQNILNEFDGIRLKSASPKDLCLKHDIEPYVLSQLARILLSTRAKATYPTVQGLLLAATELEDPGAALILVHADVSSKRERSPETQFLKPAYQLLEQLIQAENPAAIYLQGLIYERQGKNELALKMYVKSTEISTGVYAGANCIRISLGDAWTAISRLRMKGNNKVGAEEALKKAAIDYDDSAAYLYLATKMTDPSSDEHEEYLLRAAISAETEAARELGAYYFKKLQKSEAFNRKSSNPISVDSKRPLTMRVRKGQFKDADEWELWTQAFEWLGLASESKIASSQIYYAIMCRALQKPNMGLKWLDEASRVPKFAVTIAWLKEMWFSNELDLGDFDLEKISSE